MSTGPPSSFGPTPIQIVFVDIVFTQYHMPRVCLPQPHGLLLYEAGHLGAEKLNCSDHYPPMAKV